jgi:DNA-binding NarL/FixJ family response regulator
MIKQEIPDVAIVDIEMPVMGGIKTCRKRAESYPEIKIMALSMHDEIRNTLPGTSVWSSCVSVKSFQPGRV